MDTVHHLGSSCMDTGLTTLYRAAEEHIAIIQVPLYWGIKNLPGKQVKDLSLEGGGENESTFCATRPECLTTVQLPAYLARGLGSLNRRSPVARNHGFVNVGTAGGSPPPIPADLILAGKDSKIIQQNSALSLSPRLDAFEVERTILFHLLRVASGPVELVTSGGLMREEARVHGCELERDHFCPAEVDDTRFISACWF